MLLRFLTLFAAGSLAFGQSLEIEIMDRARVPKSDLAHAKKETARIFAMAGITITWSADELQPTAQPVTDFSPVPCPTRVERAHRRLQVLLLPRLPPGLPAGTLGYSLPCAQEGVQSIVYLDACERIAAQNPISLRRVLGHAMAHEIAHVLLRSSDHSTAGLMLGRWDKRMWQRAAAIAITMQPAEAQRIRLNLLIESASSDVVAMSKAPSWK